MRVVSVVALATIFLVGCGGGGGAPAPLASLVQGKVITQGSAASASDGIEVGCLNDGGVVITGADGTFRIQVPSGETIRLRLTDALGPATWPDQPDCEEANDDSPDKGDFERDIVEIEPLGAGEVCTLTLTWADGHVVECEIEIGEDGFHAEGRLWPAQPGDHAVGEVEIELREGCALVEIEAEGLRPASGIEVVLLNLDLATETLVRGEVDGKGALHLRLKHCAGDPLPFGVASFSDLAGYGIVVQDLEGNVLLVGVLPGGGFGDEPHGWPDDKPGETETGESAPGYEFDAEALERLLAELAALLGKGNPLGNLLPR